MKMVLLYMVIYAIVGMVWLEFERDIVGDGVMTGMHTVIAGLLSASLMGNILLLKKVFGDR